MGRPQRIPFPGGRDVKLFFAPPNLVSGVLHAALGFSEVGRATMDSGGKMVRYLSCPIVSH